MVLDRSGVPGPDGASHNGMWDLSILGVVPGMRVAAPRDGVRLAEELTEAIDVDDGPTAVRFPKGDVGQEVPALERRGVVDVLAAPAAAPWMKISEAVDYLRAVAPTHAVPIHQGIIDPVARPIFYGRLTEMTDTDFQVLEPESGTEF